MIKIMNSMVIRLIKKQQCLQKKKNLNKIQNKKLMTHSVFFKTTSSSGSGGISLSTLK